MHCRMDRGRETISEASGGPGALHAAAVMHLQRLAGNRAVAGLVGLQRDTTFDDTKFTPEDDATVEKIINDAEAAHLYPVGENGKRPYPYFDVKAAAADLKGRRDKEPYDTNLACAEHYMVARYMAHLGIGNPAFMVAESGIYQLGKALFGHTGDDPKSPRTPASAKQFEWAMKGSMDGTSDLL